MKLTVSEWVKEFLITLIGRTIELLFRIILFTLPMGVFLLMLQLRDKASKVSSLSVFTTDESTWQHVFPGFILVAIDAAALKKSITRSRNNVQSWIATNKYWLSFLFMFAIVALMIYSEVKK